MGELDETDLALLDAVHLQPRASFETLGRGLELDATTVARRWRALASDGLAWVSSAPGPAAPVVWAVYEAGCAPEHVDAVVTVLAAHPRVASVHVLTGSWPIYALLVAADVAAVTALVSELGEVPGLRSASSAVCLDVHRTIGWHLDALDPGQRTGMTADGDPEGHRGPVVFGPEDRALYLALQRDGRASYRDLAAALGRSPAAVRRRVAALRSAGHLVFRADFARAHGGWPVHVRLRLSVPDDAVSGVGATLGAWPETRVCLTVLDAANLMVTAQVHSLDAVPGLLARVASCAPQVRVVDRALVLRSAKSWGRLLDADGRSRGTVAVDPWAGGASARRRTDPACTAPSAAFSGIPRASGALPSGSRS